MQAFDPESLLSGKDEQARVLIAQRVGSSLADDALSEVDRRAAELLARSLVRDAIERVRCELSKAIRHAKYLPRDLALKLAHDVDSVSCPFLEVTEVFTDSDWQLLILTISRGALVAVARRSQMSEGIATMLAELGDSVVAETMFENPAAPMTEPVCHILMDRFALEIWVLDKMASREDLVPEIAVMLTAHVSSAVRDKLVETYKLPRDNTQALVDEAETGALLRIIKMTPERDLIEVARSLNKENKLTPALLKMTLQECETFLEAGFSVLSGRSLEHVRSVMLRAGPDVVTQLLIKAGIPQEMHEVFQEGIEEMRH